MSDSISGDLARQESGQGSPFDAIKRVDEQGEFWTARDLMAELDYESWRNFEAAIERAKAAALNSGSPADQFVQVAEVVAGGNLGPQTRTDYRLTRYAAYLLVMNGDPKQKPKVAEAQRYFAVKTREAEVAPVARVAIPTARELAQLVIAAEDRADAEAARREVAEHRIAELEPKAEAADMLAEAEGSLPMGAVANMFKIGRTTFFKLLRAEKILQADRRPYQEYADWFRVVTGTYESSDGGKHVHYTSHLYPAGALRLHALLTKRGHDLRKPQIDGQLRLIGGGAA